MTAILSLAEARSNGSYFDDSPSPFTPSSGGKRKFAEEYIHIPDALKSFVSAKMQSFGCSAHDIEHCYRVANVAKTLAEFEEGADPRLAYICGLLHDILDSKLSSSEDRSNAETELTDLLKIEEGFLSDSEISVVMTVIGNVGYKNIIKDGWNPSAFPIEYACVQDADLLDAIGAIGVARCFSFGGRHNTKLFGISKPPSKSTTHDEYMASQRNKENSSSIDHFFEKLLTIQSRMITEQGRVLASKRHDFMVTFLRELDEELSESKASRSGTLSRPASSYGVAEMSKITLSSSSSNIAASIGDQAAHSN
jgi:uncharacterized protein